MRQACISQKPAGLGGVIRRDEEAPAEGADGALQGAHMLVGHQDRNAGAFQEGSRDIDKDDIVRPDQLDHSAPPVALRRRLTECGAFAAWSPELAYPISTPCCDAAGTMRLDGADAFRATMLSCGPARESRILGIAATIENPTKPDDAGLNDLVALVADGMSRVNSTILSRTGSDVAMIPEVANHLIASGGKRLRPILTLACAKLCGYVDEGGRGGDVKLAASVEFMHTATLLHDDVVDESDMRRGRVAARIKWGNEASVLVGDFLLGQAFRMMVEVGSLKALDILSAAATVIAEGEVMQLSAAKNLETDENAYLAVIRGKTAELFAAACEVGPVIAGRSEEEQAAARSYGMNLGIAFQLIDDALDYGGTSAALGKNVGDDFREGKITLPIVLAYRRGTEEDRAFWRRTLQQGEIHENDLATALATLRRHGTLEETVARARHYGEQAIAALAIFPEGPAKAALLDAVEFCVARAH